jgi:hypothetical protein
LSKAYPANVGRKIVEVIGFEESETEKLELIKRHFGLKHTKEAIKALIAEKCDDIKLTEEKQHKQQIEETRTMEYLEKSEYKCPM